MNDEIINLCEEIKNNNSCPFCGGDYDNFTCKYCDEKNNVLEKLQQELIEKLNKNTNLTEEELMSLYKIDSLNIDKVNNILTSTNFKKHLNDVYNNIETKVNNNILSSNDYEYLLLFIETNTYPDKKISFINILMKELLLEKLDMSIDKQLNLIKEFTEMFMKDKIPNPKVTFKDLGEKTLGQSSYNYIDLNYDKTIEHLENKNYLELINTVFHECTHTFQRYTIEKGKHANYLLLLQSKEDIIRKNYPFYYKDNYFKESLEVEARYCGDLYTYKYLNILGLQPQNMDVVNKRMQENLKLIEDENRIINGKESTVSEIFDSLNKDSNLLKKYPILNLEYKEKDGNIIPKTLEEIQEDYNSNSIFEMTKEEKEYLYSHLIEKYKKTSNKKASNKKACIK